AVLRRRREPVVSMIHSGSSQVDGRSISIECPPATRRSSAPGPPLMSFRPSSSWPRRSLSRNADAAAWSLITDEGLVEYRNYRTSFVAMTIAGAGGLLQPTAETEATRRRHRPWRFGVTHARCGIRSPTWGAW